MAAAERVLTLSPVRPLGTELSPWAWAGAAPRLPWPQCGSGLLPQGLLPSVHPAPNADQNNGPLGARGGRQRQPRKGELTFRVQIGGLPGRN